MNIVYYKVPKTFTDSEEGYSKIVITDNGNTLAGKRTFAFLRKIDFFTDDLDFLSDIIWRLKTEDESVYFEAQGKKTSACEKYILKDQILDARNSNETYEILYESNGVLTKTIAMTEGETLDVMVKDELLEQFESILKEFATEESYEKWELGE